MEFNHCLFMVGFFKESALLCTLMSCCRYRTVPAETEPFDMAAADTCYTTPAVTSLVWVRPRVHRYPSNRANRTKHVRVLEKSRNVLKLFIEWDEAQPWQWNACDINGPDRAHAPISELKKYTANAAVGDRNPTNQRTPHRATWRHWALSRK